MADILGIAVLVIFGLFVIDGWRKGLFKKITGVLAFVLSCVIVPFLMPYVADYLKNNTPLETVIVSQCEKTVTDTISSLLKKSTGNGIDRDQIRTLIDQYGWQYGVDSSQVDYLSDSQLQSLIDQYFSEYVNGSTGGSLLNSLSQIEQIELINSLPLPKFLQEKMLSNNNRDGYKSFNASDFGSYIVRFVANLILNIISFLITLLVTYVGIWIILKVVGVASRLPLINLLDRAGGVILGGVQGLIAVWFVFMIISMLSGTKIGMTVNELISSSTILKPIYQNNVLMKIITNAINGNM